MQIVTKSFFTQATALKCSHSFCKYCIDSWLFSQQKSLCPLCKAPITSEVPALALDNTVYSLTQKLEADAKEKRLVVVAERKGILFRLVLIWHFVLLSIPSSIKLTSVHYVGQQYSSSLCLSVIGKSRSSSKF